MKRTILGRPISAIFTAVLLVFITLSLQPVFGQGTNTGTVIGTASDPTGAVIPGVAITLTDTTTGIRLTSVTNTEGQYVFVNVRPGTYTISSTKAGFSKDEFSALS